MDFTHKKCLCTVADCGKCLTLGCTDDKCKVHRTITKWRYRKRLLESLKSKAGKMQGRNELAALQDDIEAVSKEIERLNEVMNIKQ